MTIRFRTVSFATIVAIVIGLAYSSIPSKADDAKAPADVPKFAKERPVVKVGDPIFQFNQKDLTGFYTYLKDSKYEDPHKVFTVKDGMIVVSGEEYGGFITKDEFQNYVLTVEWRWGAKTWKPREKATRDSGILLHCVGADGASGAWMESVECQIIEGGCGDFILVGGKAQPKMTFETRVGPDKQLYYEKGGTSTTTSSGRINWWGRDPAWKDVINFRGQRDVEKPVGEWNTIEVICDGDTVVNIVNGYVVNVGTKSSHTKGKILLQSEAAEIHFRKIEVRPIIK